MSVGFQVWVIVPTYIRDLYGLSNQQKRAGIRAALGPRTAPLGERFATEIAAGRMPPPDDAIEHIFDGRYPDGVDGAMHAYVLEAAVDMWGRFQPNAALMPSGTELPERVDRALETMGVDGFRIAMLGAGRLPCPVPPVADFPGFGHLTAEQARAAHEQLDGARYQGHDADVAAAIDCARGWLRAATRRKTTGLVGFFH